MTSGFGDPEEYTPEDQRALDLTVRLEGMLVEGPEALARFEGERASLRGSRQVRLDAEIERLAALVEVLADRGTAARPATGRHGSCYHPGSRVP